MFGRKRSQKPARLADQHTSFSTVIGEGTAIQGNLVATGGLRVDGQITGDIDVRPGEDAVLAIGKEGRVEGNIRGERIVVGGTVLGNIEARTWVELRDGSRVSGDIHYKTLSIEPGAQAAGKLLNDIVEAAEEAGAVVSIFAGER